MLNSSVDNISQIFAQTLYVNTQGLPLKIKDALASCLLNQLKNSSNIVEKIAYLKQISKNLTTIYTNNEEFSICLRIAELALKGGLKDSVYKANFFHHQNEIPKSCKGLAPILILEPFYFYKI